MTGIKYGNLAARRRKKEEVVIAMVSAIKNVLTVLAVAIKAVQ
jgi:hypothetical protein